MEPGVGLGGLAVLFNKPLLAVLVNVKVPVLKISPSLPPSQVDTVKLNSKTCFENRPQIQAIVREGKDEMVHGIDVQVQVF